MDKITLILAMLGVAASALVQILTDPRITWRFLARSVVALAVYSVHLAVGFSVVMFLLPHGPETAAGVTAALLGWIGLGALGLVRFAPRLREPPAFLMNFGMADYICLFVIAGGVVWVFGAGA